ncbi:MAG TPA: Pls/PosA family non-ribosomal peptide synthetase [Candidatus Acidoferrales bacterium]|jgi:non-ribosomal peptide synthetase-like protein|nr:Pls/PosA family non-ribosomal peptide synthetase [Candidatus Acidoferrales bacterium]
MPITEKHQNNPLPVTSTVVPAVLRGASRPDLLRNECLADILTATARHRPQHPALVWDQQVITYAELDALSDTLAGALFQRGAAAGRVIGLFLPRGADLLVAQAGITKSGAAWLPFDAGTPLERLKTCLQSAEAVGLVTCREWLPRFAGLNLPVWAVEDLFADKNPRSLFPAAQPADPAYVIYTSGSTGQPKGIVISHRSICHFLRSENELLGVTETDLVYQGFSAAFDMSFEEIWISYLVGATLWIAPAPLVGDPDLLAQTLKREHITVLHAVPTLVGLLEDLPPTLRLINLGGEACPDSLAQRLVGPGRKIFNTYGPTETAVSASLAELKTGEPVTIGMPLPNYGLLVVDEQRRPLPAGEMGELCIFGPGLAIGYLGQPDLTAERFVPNPLAANPGEGLMYLTGDLARIEPGGPAHCLGRVDSQVKIRGFRVELDEITKVLSDQPGIRTAAVVLRPLGGVDQVVAFVIPATDQTTDPAKLRQALALRLPAYMVPAHFESVTELPRLASGKVDLKVLRGAPLGSVAPNHGQPATPRNEEEQALYAALEKLFPGRTWQPESDFFDDLGGHSLLAARLVSILRSDERYASLGVQDVYRERRLSGIARVMEQQSRRKRSAAAVRAPVPWHRRFFCGLAQATVIPFLVFLHIADWLAPFFVYHYYTGDDGDSIPLAVLYSLATFVLIQLAAFPVAIASKWLVAGRLQAGRYPLWGVTYFRWWLSNKFCELPHVYLLAATPWMPLYLRSLGARIGRDVLIENISLGAPELLTVEDGVSIGTFVNLENARVEGGLLVIGPIHLQKDAVVDSYAVLENDTRLGERAWLGGQSALAAGRQIPADEAWEGAPAQPVNRPKETLPPRPHIGWAWQRAQALLFGVTAIAVSVLFFLPCFPAFMLIDWIDAHSVDVFSSDLHPITAFGLFFLLAIPASALLIFVTALLVGLLRWILPRQVAGTSSIHGYAFWRKKLSSLILDHSLQVLHGIYASVYASTWLRFLGVKVGRYAEVSTAEGMVPELLTLGADSFIADGAMLGDEEQRGGWMILKPTAVGSRSFVGNGAYVPNGTTVPDDVLIGVQTRTPDNEHLKSGQTWMGSPALLLPARECLTGFPESLTFRPSWRRRLARGIIEGLRIVLPLALVIATGYLIVVLVMPLAEENGWGMNVVAALSLAGCLYGLASFLLVVALKWILVGRYRPCARAMWTSFVWTSEAVTNLYESLAVPNFLDILRGTPMLPWALRLLGAKIGRGVYLNTTDLTEFDCVRIGDEAELNAWCGPQTHLFEDRVMKIGLVEIGAQTTIGPRTTILYDTNVGDRVSLGPLTLVAKGERLPAGTRWEGSPAAPVAEK